ncbi:MAG: hypothetical protein HY243_10630 [Proteobacteria bacterium]|nr:hypothetical protein [Pseudomonadota bacterium]
MRGTSLIPALLAITTFATAAEADCIGVQAVDRCLVGTWKMTGGGPQEWMRQNMKGAPIVQTSASNNTITLSADGTFSTGVVHSSATITATKGDTMRGTGNMTIQASGKWSAAAGKFNICPVTMSSSGKVNIEEPNGRTMTMAMPKMPVKNSTMTYTCAGNTMKTVKAMPRGTAMTTIYTKVP